MEKEKFLRKRKKIEKRENAQRKTWNFQRIHLMMLMIWCTG